MAAKLTPVLLRTVQPIAYMAPAERDAVRRAMTEGVQGINEQHHRRWVRGLGRLVNGEPGEVTCLYFDVERSLRFHRRWMAIEERIFDGQETFQTLKAFRAWLKTGASFGRYVAGSAGLVFEPASVNFEDCGDDAMREFTEDALAFLRTDRALAELWPHTPPLVSLQGLERLIRNPKQPHQE